MKSLELREVEGLNYRDILAEVIRRPADPQKGVDIQEMRLSIRMLDKLEAANGTFELEDAEHDLLKVKTEHFTWAFVDRRLNDLIDEVLQAT